MQTVNASKPVSLFEGEVVSVPPNLKVKLLSDEKLIIPKELLIVPERLTNHKMLVKLTDTVKGSVSVSSSNVSEGMSSAGYTSHTHDVSQITISDGTFNLSEGTLEFLDELKKGDKVLLASFPGGQKFFILDRIVTY